MLVADVGHFPSGHIPLKRFPARRFPLPFLRYPRTFSPHPTLFSCYLVAGWGKCFKSSKTGGKVSGRRKCPRGDTSGIEASRGGISVFSCRGVPYCLVTCSLGYTRQHGVRWCAVIVPTTSDAMFDTIRRTRCQINAAAEATATEPRGPPAISMRCAFSGCALKRRRSRDLLVGHMLRWLLRLCPNAITIRRYRCRLASTIHSLTEREERCCCCCCGRN